MTALLVDLRQAFRSLGRAPLFTSAVALTLALGIGLTSAMLAVFDRLLMRPLPLQDLATLVGVYEADTKLGWTHNVVSAPNYLDFERQGTELQAMAAFRESDAVLSGESENVRVTVGRVTHAFFPILRVVPELGRVFTPAEDRIDGPKAVLLSHAFWKSQFGADPSIVGRAIRLDGVAHMVIGVLPAGFHTADLFDRQIYLPMAFTREERVDRARHAYSAIGRLKPGATIATAELDLKRIARSLAVQYPGTNADGSATVSPLLFEVRSDGREPKAVMFVSLSSFLLLIACANVSNLILARGAVQQHDLAIRAALGAVRGTLIRRLLVESMVLGLLGSLGALGVAKGLMLLVQDWFGTAPELQQLDFDLRTLLLSLVVTLAAIGFSGIVPIWRLSRVQPAEAMKEGQKGSQGLRQRRFQAALLTVQVGLAAVLLVGAGLMVRTLVNLRQVQLGFDPDNVLTAGIALSRSRYPGPSDRQGFARRLHDRLDALPGVKSAAVANSLFFFGSAGNWEYTVEGEETPPGRLPITWVHAVTADYFATVGIRLQRGWTFEDMDPDSCLVNEAFVRHQWPGQDPLGKRVHLGPSNGPSYTIVGVVGNAINRNLARPPVPQIYTSLYHDAFQNNEWDYVYLRTAGDPLSLAGHLKAALRDLDLDLAAQPIRTLKQGVERQMKQPQIVTALFAGFGILGLILAAVGLYGLMAFMVAQRTREMGIRQALGADIGRLVRMVLGQSMRLVWLGLGVGLVACLALGRTMASFIYGVAPTDPTTLTVVAVLILVVSLIATVVPAVRATSLAPAVALREE